MSQKGSKRGGKEWWAPADFMDRYNVSLPDGRELLWVDNSTVPTDDSDIFLANKWRFYRELGRLGALELEDQPARDTAGREMADCRSVYVDARIGREKFSDIIRWVRLNSSLWFDANERRLYQQEEVASIARQAIVACGLEAVIEGPKD